MRILTVDIGTGTQDIYLYDSRLDIENGLKLILPSPTMIVRHRLQAATRRGQPVVLSGVTMGGGPNAWAAETHLARGLPLFATAEAARSFNDDLEKAREMGISLVSDDEARQLAATCTAIELRDFDFDAIRRAFEAFGVSLAGLDAAAVAVFDHGNAPPEVSDRQFRFDYLHARLSEPVPGQGHPLSRFAFRAEAVPAEMTRLQAVVKSALTSGASMDAPLVVMDTAPAAVLGASYDPHVAARRRVMIANIGNFHTLAFRLAPGGGSGSSGIEGVFEHHTGLLDRPKLEALLLALADGSLTHAAVFGDHGHGALVYSDERLPLGQDGFDVAVVGPRRNLIRPSEGPPPALRPYFAVPFGDMMLAGCFGLLAATADLLPELEAPIRASLSGQGGSGAPPWEI